MGRKKQSDMEALAKLLGLEAPKGQEHETTEDVSRAAEAAIIYAETPKSFIRKNCKTCGRTFAHTRGAIAYCSNTCRAKSLAEIGIVWDWNKPPATRWDLYEGGEPLIAPPEAVKLIDQVSDTQDHLKCPVYNHMRDQPEHGAWCWGDEPVPDGMIMVPYKEKECANATGVDTSTAQNDVRRTPKENSAAGAPPATASPAMGTAVAKPDPLDILAELGLS